MTEREWLECSDPQQMLPLFREKSSVRKAQLLAVACCRRIWHRLRDPAIRQAVETVASYIEGRATAESLESARRDVEQVQQTAPQGHRLEAGATAVHSLTWIPFWTADHWPCLGSVLISAGQAAAEGAQSAGRNRKQRKQMWGRAYAEERAAQCDLLRDIAGNPFRPLVWNPSWAQLTGGIAARLAASIYEEHAFERLPILADALEEAGCDHLAILGHLRGSGPHVRGCHVLDGLLGKM